VDARDKRGHDDSEADSIRSKALLSVLRRRWLMEA